MIVGCHRRIHTTTVLHPETTKCTLWFMFFQQKRFSLILKLLRRFGASGRKPVIWVRHESVCVFFYLGTDYLIIDYHTSVQKVLKPFTCFMLQPNANTVNSQRITIQSKTEF